MAREFTHTSLPSRVVFGAGSLGAVRTEVERLGLHCVLVLTTSGRRAVADRVCELLGPSCAGVHAEAVSHVPAAVASAGIARAVEVGADATLAVGGGSAIGLGKAIALETGLPVIAVPTTYAGSEMTPVWGITDAGSKRTGRDQRVLPVAVVYDTDLTIGLPPEPSVTSAVNALAHAVEAVYAPDGSPAVELLAIEAARVIFAGLPRVAAQPRSPDIRDDLLYAAWLAGMCLGTTTMSLHHTLCHVIGGAFDLSHAWTHTVLLPYVMDVNLQPGTRRHTLVSEATGRDRPGAALQAMLARLGYWRSLADLGMPAAGIDMVVSTLQARPFANPTKVTSGELRALVEAAYSGAALGE